jgi:hypothetical protein
MKCILINSNNGIEKEIDFMQFNSLLEFKNSLKFDEIY